VLSPETGKCQALKPLTVVKSGYLAGAIGSTASISSKDGDAEDAKQCSTMLLDTLPWKTIRLSLVGLYTRAQPFRYRSIMHQTGRNY